MLKPKPAIGSSATRPLRAQSARAPRVGRKSGSVRVLAVDPASSAAAVEVLASLAGLAAVVAATVGLGQTIRHFNEDPEVERLNDLAYKSRQATRQAKPVAAPVAAVAPPPAPAAAASATPAAVASRPPVAAAPQPDVRSWIGAWLAKRPAEEAPPARAAAAAQAPEELAPQPFSMAAGITTRVTEPSLPQADPATAAAVLDIMTANTPVGITGPEAPSAPSPQQEREPAMAAAAPAPPAPSANQEAREAARAYEQKVSSIRAGATPAYQAARRMQAQATPGAASSMRQRVVHIKESYQSKVDSLWQEYESKRQHEQALLARNDQILMDLSALDAAQEAERRRSPLEQLWQRVLAFFAALVQWVRDLVARLTGGGPGAAGAPA